jgi:starch synthase (maltosyl-transferring)
LIELLSNANVPCECLGADPRKPVQAVARLVRTLGRFRPRLVQSFMFHANAAVRLAAPWAGNPWVVSGLRVAERQKTWHLIVDRLTAPLAIGSVCVSQGVFRFSRDVVRFNSARLAVIPNGIDPARFDHAVPIPRAAMGIPDSAHLAVCIGRLDVQKGLPELLAAAEQALSHRPDWHLALAGDGPGHDWVLGWIAGHPDSRDKVHWLGPCDDIPGLLKSADLLVHASHWEGMPNAVLEAMAARRAVVGTAVEGTEDLVVPGRTGWLVAPRNVAALARALIEAADSPDARRRYGEAGRRRIEDEFSFGRTVAAYEELWAGILGYRLPVTEPDLTPV